MSIVHAIVVQFTVNKPLRRDVKRRYLSGQTMREIADACHICKARVHQLLLAMKVDRREVYSQRCWSLQEKERTAIVEQYGYHPFVAFSSHRKRAEYRGIKFLLTFSEWWSIWIASGKWSERGRLGHQYCMARTRDLGAYAIGNVTIKTNRENYAERSTV